MKREILALVLAAVVLAGCAYPAPIPPAPQFVNFSTIWYGSTYNWFGLACIAILMSAFFVSIGYMLGTLFNNPTIINWAKGELLQVFASALIVGGLFWLVAMVNAFSMDIVASIGLTCPTNVVDLDLADQYAASTIIGGPCHIMTAQQYLEIMYENLFDMSRDLLVTGSLISAMSNFSITLEWLPPPWLTVTFVPFASLNVIFETLMMCFDMITKTMMLLKFQIYFLNYVWMALFPMLLVLGVILRTFWFSRRLGGLLIAIAIGIYLIFPLGYTLSYYILGGTSAGTYVVKINPTAYMSITDDEEAAHYTDPLPHDPNDAIVPHTITNDVGIAGRIDTLENRNFLKDVLAIGKTGGTAVAPVFGLRPDKNPTENNWVVGEESVLENTAKLLIYATFVPFIVLMGTISFIKGLSPLLGGDVEIAGITHLI
jgi:hypothetical protein